MLSIELKLENLIYNEDYKWEYLLGFFIGFVVNSLYKVYRGTIFDVEPQMKDLNYMKKFGVRTSSVNTNFSGVDTHEQSKLGIWLLMPGTDTNFSRVDTYEQSKLGIWLLTLGVDTNFSSVDSFEQETWHLATDTRCRHL